MIIAMTTTRRLQQRYDHRLRDLVQSTELSAWTICTFSRELSHADGQPLSLRVEVGESATDDQRHDDQVSPAAAL
jgi:hypothetical protein